MIPAIGPFAGPTTPNTGRADGNPDAEIRGAAPVAIATPGSGTVATAIETPVAVDPAEATETVQQTTRDALPSDDLRPSLLPPDPNAPTGPPPAFEASLLDRLRELGAVGDASVPDFAPEAGPPQSADPYDVPPVASERAAADVATLRRIETPYDTATVDVAR